MALCRHCVTSAPTGTKVKEGKSINHFSPCTCPLKRQTLHSVRMWILNLTADVKIWQYLIHKKAL